MEKVEGKYAPKEVVDWVMAEARRLVGSDEGKIRQLFSRASWQWFQRTWGTNEFYNEPGSEHNSEYGPVWMENTLKELRDIAAEGDQGWESEEMAEDVIAEIAH